MFICHLFVIRFMRRMPSSFISKQSDGYLNNLGLHISEKTQNNAADVSSMSRYFMQLLWISARARMPRSRWVAMAGGWLSFVCCCFLVYRIWKWSYGTSGARLLIPSVLYLELWEKLTTIDCFFRFIMEDVFYRKTHLGPVNIYLL